MRSAEDMHEARDLLRRAGGTAHLIAKIERAEAVANLEGIIDASDAVMVARGDLGVEMGYAGLTGLQKKILQLTRSRHKVAITATQMMESMVHQRMPTRAEVSDVANAVMDGTDAVMLSAETAVGEFPVRAVAAMAEVCVGAETYQFSGGATAGPRRRPLRGGGRGHRHGGDVHRQPPAPAGDHGADRIGEHDAVDVPRAARTSRSSPSRGTR